MLTKFNLNFKGNTYIKSNFKDNITLNGIFIRWFQIYKIIINLKNNLTILWNIC